MKQCPECSREYEDSVNFCANDGKSLVAKATTRTRLCPHCANSIPENVTKCPYCKADLAAASAPQWPTRADGTVESRQPTQSNRLPLVSIIVLVVGVMLSALGLFLTLGPRESSESRVLLEQKIKELADKEQKVQQLESQLSQLRQEMATSSNQQAALRGQLEESQKELSSTRQRIGSVTRDVDRSATDRTQPPPRASPRPPDSPPPQTARRPAEPGIYETIRTTTVHEDPSGSSRVVAEIKRGTKVNVVRSVGDWLEVRSKQGNPPGFIRWDDAMFTSRAN